MNRAYVIDADVFLAFRLQLVAKVTLLTLMFSSAMPLLSAFVAIYCFLAHWVDKRLFFYVLRKPPHTQQLRLMYFMTAWLMPLAVTFRLGFACFIFLSLRCKCDGEVWRSPRRPPPRCPSYGGPLASRWQVALSSTPFHAFGRDLQPVQYIVLSACGLLLLPLLAFLVREARLLWAARRKSASGKEASRGGAEALASTTAPSAAPTDEPTMAPSAMTTSAAAAPFGALDVVSSSKLPSGKQGEGAQGGAHEQPTVDGYACGGENGCGREMSAFSVASGAGGRSKRELSTLSAASGISGREQPTPSVTSVTSATGGGGGRRRSMSEAINSRVRHAAGRSEARLMASSWLPLMASGWPLLTASCLPF